MEFVKNTIFNKKFFITATGAGAATGGYLAYTGKLAPLAAAAAAKTEALVVSAAPHVNAFITSTQVLLDSCITNLTPYVSSLATNATAYTAMIGLTPVTLSIALGAAATAILIIVLIRKNRTLANANQSLFQKLRQSHQVRNELEETIRSSDELFKLTPQELVIIGHQISLKKAEIQKMGENIQNMERLIRCVEQDCDEKEELISKQLNQIEQMQNDLEDSDFAFEDELDKKEKLIKKLRQDINYKIDWIEGLLMREQKSKKEIARLTKQNNKLTQTNEALLSLVPETSEEELSNNRFAPLSIVE